jgi:hypothetical protein
MSGSAEEAAARSFCRAELERASFSCEELPFDYSEWPGRWGPPLAALVQAATILAVARTAMVWDPLASLVLGAALMTALFLASGDARRRWTRVFPFQRSRSVNLQAIRGEPRVWLIAHLDTKSQSVPMLWRIASTVALWAVTLVAVGVLLLSVFGDINAHTQWLWIEIAIVLAALPAVFCWVGDRSPGAVDNASGVAAVLIAAASAQSHDLGVLITSGEELGLAGAHQWAHSFHGRPSVVNCDTIDDAGSWRCMYTGSRPDRLVRAAETSAGRMGLKLRIGRLIPGVLTDGVAFADKGFPAITLSRGTLATLARIHTRRDNLPSLHGKGIEEGARLLLAIAKEID